VQGQHCSIIFLPTQSELRGTIGTFKVASAFDLVGQLERFIEIARNRMHYATVNYVIRILACVDLQVTQLAAISNPTMFMKTS
jgi:hypothetical protein